MGKTLTPARFASSESKPFRTGCLYTHMESVLAQDCGDGCSTAKSPSGGEDLVAHADAAL